MMSVSRRRSHHGDVNAVHHHCAPRQRRQKGSVRVVRLHERALLERGQAAPQLAAADLVQIAYLVHAPDVFGELRVLLPRAETRKAGLHVPLDVLHLLQLGWVILVLILDRPAVGLCSTCTTEMVSDCEFDVPC